MQVGESESQKAVISTPDIGYSFSINPPWTWKNSPHHWGISKIVKQKSSIFKINSVVSTKTLP